MSNKNRGDRIQLLHKVVKKYYKPVPIPEGRSVLEHLVYACCSKTLVMSLLTKPFIACRNPISIGMRFGSQL